jgi:hypothetical protein
MKDEMVTSEEGVRLYEEAGLSENTFYRHAREGKIQKSLPENQERNALYSNTDIQANIEKHYKRKGITPPPTKRTIPDIILDWVKPEDVPSGLALDQIVYNEMFLANIEVYMAWRRKNPKISMGAFDAKDRRTRYGYVGLIPLPEHIILDILMGKKDEKEITPDEILTYDNPGEYTLLANSAVIHPDYPELANSIIHAIMNFWIDVYPEKKIKRIYAQTVSDQGRTLARKLYLGPLYIIKDNVLTRIEDAYVIDMQEPATSKVLRQFQEKLKMKDKGVASNS